MRAIIFDLDGTLIDSQEDILAAFSKAFSGLGAPLPERDQLLSVIGRRLEDRFSQFLGGDGAEGARLFRAWYEGHFLDTTRPFDGVDESLRALENRFSMALCTMKKGIYARRLVGAFGWEDLLGTVLGSEEGFAPKPSPAMLLESCRRLDVRAAESFYVGDTALDAQMAAAAGMPFLFVKWGYGDRRDLKGLPVQAILESPKELGVLAARFALR